MVCNLYLIWPDKVLFGFFFSSRRRHTRCLSDCRRVLFRSVLRALLKLALDFPLHLPAHAGVTAAAIGAADLDSIDGSDHAPAGPVGLQDANSLQSLGHQGSAEHTSEL